MKRAVLWYGLLTKRLFRKPAFLILLLCVPLLAGAMTLVASQDKSFVTVALVCATEDPAARRSADRLLNSDSLVRCTEYASEADARAAVTGGQADAAWIFGDDTSDALQRFVSGRGTRGAVRVIEREETVFLRLAREQLAAAIYPEASYMLFRTYLVERLGAPADASDDFFDSYYETPLYDGPIIVFERDDGSAVTSSVDYLVVPVRGLLALLMVLTGLASAMFLNVEERRECFLRLGRGSRRFLPLLYHLTALLPMALAVLIALRLSGLLGAWPAELGRILLYCASAAVFSELLRKLCRSQALLGALIPVLMALMLALCPVFLDLQILEPVRRLLPPYYYLNAIRSSRFVWQLAVYTCIAAIPAVLLPGQSSEA